MGEPYGRRISLSPARRLVGDLLHFARKVPTVPVQRRMRLGPLVMARHGAVPRPSWCALFTRAYAIVAARRPELRRAYLDFPWPHLYEHPVNVASVAFGRRLDGEEVVLFAQVRNPEQLSVEQLDRFLHDCKELPIPLVGSFRRALRVSRLPRPLRWFLWWLALNSSGYNRARNLGTFGVSVYSSLGAEALHPLSPLTTTLNYGVIAEDGTVDVRIIYDHRVLDGATVARVLGEMETVMIERAPRWLGRSTQDNLAPCRDEVGVTSLSCWPNALTAPASTEAAAPARPGS